MGWDGPMTHRQYLVWMTWLGEEWNKPSRTDYYIMANTVAVKQVLAKKPQEIKIEHAILPFKTKSKQKTTSDEDKEQHRKNIAAVSRAKWLGVVGMAPVVVYKNAEVDPNVDNTNS